MEEQKGIVAQIVEWTKLKCRIQVEEKKNTYFKEREIWWASIGANIGTEQNGKNERHERPVLVLKKISADTLWVLPVTTADHVGTWYFPTEHRIGDKKQTIVLSQIRTISAKRLIKKQRTLPAEEFLLVKDRLKKFL